jgi:hypothetical protein
MEILMTITNFLILGLIIISPILILIFLKRSNNKRTPIKYFLISFFILAVLIWIFAWWGDKSDMILLNRYGYNYDGLNDNERFRNVLEENINKVKGLETDIMGIGWPLKAIFGFIITIPYIIFVYFGNVLINRESKKNKA